MSARRAETTTQDWEHAQAPKRHIWPWLIAFAIVAGLAVAAWFAAEALARDIVTKTIRDQLIERLALPASQQIGVEVDGVIIPQLIGGSLDEVTISSQDVPVGDVSGDVTITATDVPIREGESMGGATATVALDEEQLRAIMAGVEGFPSGTLALAEPNVTFATELSVLGITVPIGVELTPSAVEGDLVLTPAGLTLGDADISADELRSRFGGVADAVLRDWTVCLAQHLPAGVTVTDIDVEGALLVADADIDGAIVTDPALQANRTCG
jgi:hypothetical protein